MPFSKQKIAVIGLGKTGIATCRFLAERGAHVRVTDEKPWSLLEDVVADLKGVDGTIEPLSYDETILSGVDLVVPSPGVPPANTILSKARRDGIPVISELELASRFLRIPMIAITGTNGKTTTTALTGYILAESGRKVFVGGNIGHPLIGYVGGPQEEDYAVVEVSSFQLQWTETFRPQVAVLLNTTSDHVDYHGSFAAYQQTKERIFARQTPADFALVNADDRGTPGLLKRLASQALCFSSSRRLEGVGVFREGNRLIYRPPGGSEEIYPLEMVKLPGRHNIENVMAALMAARLCRCTPEDVVSAVAGFKGMSHRIEFAGEIKGVDFYDDSKGTNVDAVRRALETFERPVVLLMGGRDKEGDFETLIPAVRDRVKHLVLFGEARERIHSLIGGVVETQIVPTLRQGVVAAFGKARPGDVILLSPGCASFDEFKDYKDRGRFFKKMVEELAHA